MRSRPLIVSLVLLGACGGSTETSPPAETAAADPASESAAPASRVPDPAERAAMIEVLKGEAASDKRVWFVVTPGNAETAALATALEETFRAGGWEPTTQRLTGMVLKPGPVRILVGDEFEIPTVDSARRALEAGGLTIETGTGYRGFYEEKKQENPNWPGIPMTPEQGFLVVLPPEAPAA